MNNTPTLAPQVQEFLDELATLCWKYKITLHACGCCSGINIYRASNKPDYSVRFPHKSLTAESNHLADSLTDENHL